MTDTTFTRRAYFKAGSALVGGGLFAGCLGGSSSAGESTGGGSGNGSNGTESNDTASNASSGSYGVSMSPVGTVAFEEVPSNVLVYSLLYADMMVAYGHGDAVNSLGFDAKTGGNTLDAYYARLGGVSFDRTGLTQLNTGSGSISVGKELFYELNSDLHLVDPCLVASFDGWDSSDIDEIRTNIAPFFGNSYSRTHSQPPRGCRDRYQYYTLWEIAEKVASVFRERQKFAKLETVHRELLERIQSKLPPESERPTVGSVIFMDETFYPSKINTSGFGNAHVRPLKATDAFAGDDVSFETSYGYEQMLEIDPEVILHRFGIASFYDVAQIRKTLENHPLGSELTAVQNGRVYPSGNPIQGPLMNLFQVEMTAKQLYPEQFGEWPGYDGGAYPKVPADERLFDRTRVAAIVNGNG